jgi:hypothetical protein
MAKKVVTFFAFIFSFGLIYLFSIIIGNAFDVDLNEGAKQQLEIYSSIRPEDNAAAEDILRIVNENEIDFETFEYCQEKSFLCTAEELERPELKRFLTEKEKTFNEILVLFKSQKSWLKTNANNQSAKKFLKFHEAYLYYLSRLSREGKTDEALRALVESQKFFTSLLYHSQFLSNKLLILRNLTLNKSFLESMINEKILVNIPQEEAQLFRPKLWVKKMIESSQVAEFGFFSQSIDEVRENPWWLSENFVIVGTAGNKFNESEIEGPGPEATSLEKANIFDHVLLYFVKPNLTKQTYLDFLKQSLESSCKKGDASVSDANSELNSRCDVGFNEDLLWPSSSIYLRNFVGIELAKRNFNSRGIAEAYKRIQSLADQLAMPSEVIQSVVAAEAVPKAEPASGEEPTVNKVDPHEGHISGDGN